MLAALARCEKAFGKIYNVGGDHEISINELAELVIQRTHSSSTVIHMDYEEAYGMMFRDIKHRRPELSRLNSAIDYRPAYSLEQTIDHLITLFKT
jgi:UDP-glucose 4-epimerase